MVKKKQYSASNNCKPVRLTSFHTHEGILNERLGDTVHCTHFDSEENVKYKLWHTCPVYIGLLLLVALFRQTIKAHYHPEHIAFKMFNTILLADHCIICKGNTTDLQYKNAQWS